MKKIIITLSIISVLFLVGCKSNEKELVVNTDNQQQVVENNNMSQEKNVSETDKIKSLLASPGGWMPVLAYDLTNDEVSDLFEVYGSGIQYGGTLEFKEDGTFAKMIGVYGEDYMGKYEIDVDKNSIYFTFETGKKMEGSYNYIDGEIVSVNIIEDYEISKYRVTLNKNNIEE